MEQKTSDTVENGGIHDDPVSKTTAWLAQAGIALVFVALIVFVGLRVSGVSL